MTFSETVADAAAWLNDFGKYQMVMANFCELVAEGVPDDGKIRDYVTDDQAEACFNLSEPARSTACSRKKPTI
jgi:hypothetical protein